MVTSAPFLSPSLPGLRSMSPPPRGEADDYLNVHGHHSDRKKPHNVKKRTKTGNTELEEDAEELLPKHESPLPQSRATSSPESNCGLCVAGSHISNNDEPDRFAVDEAEREGQLWSLIDTPDIPDVQITQGIQTADVGGRETPPPIGPLRNQYSEMDSPAADALRNLSNSRSTKESDSPMFRRMSNAFANTFEFLKSGTSVSGSRSQADSAGIEDESRSRRHGAHQKSLGYREGNRRLPSSQKGKTFPGLVTPSSITLRKASNANESLPEYARSSMTASVGLEDDQFRSPDAPPSELLAFYSSTTNEVEDVVLSIFPSPGVSGSQSAPKERLSTTKSSPPNPMLPLNMQSTKIQGRSALAASATTFTDVHIAPGTFAVESKPRKQSVLQMQSPPRRISVVQFHTRNSVHEVIWREDETTSDSSLATSSRTSTSPQRHDQSPQSGKGGPMLQAKSAPKPQNPAVPALAVSPSLSATPEAGLFQWSWRKPTPSSSAPQPAAISTPESSEPLKVSRPQLQRRDSASNPDFTRDKRPDDPHPGLTALKRSASDLQDILSCPPLRDRRSTPEWRAAPSVDFNDPLIGKEDGQYTEIDDNIGNCDDFRKFVDRRKSSHVLGKIGTRLGSNAHVRVVHNDRP